ncbi:GHKL domain-containing protein [Aureisphaera sp. CAU 1614]|uniref:histidine kinase n=1 Tax=Halomarinibacterium sedimenti TaxID=2857106 RepID=A0A9X1FP70_9FLAO|nr:ATP-binding protein [Halomarinibacterium sedimenti]MBW2937995.1 GHKL domain-containing protein [Halomarinibacterium sedimenti]
MIIPKLPANESERLNEVKKYNLLDTLPEESLLYLNYIEESSLTLKNYIDGMLQFYKSTELLDQQKNSISVVGLFEEIKEMLILNKAEFVYPKDPTILHINKPAISQILLNLVDNAFKFNAVGAIKVQVSFFETTDYYIFTVEDNGMGIPKEKQDDVFEIFKTGGIKDLNRKEGTGIGLATVKNLVNKLGGEITLESEIGKGSIFTFTIKK